MSASRLLNRSLAIVAGGLVAVAVPGLAQEVSVQKLIERGALQEAVQRAEGDRDNPESTYLAAQALIKSDNDSGANERFSRLRESGDESWSAIGESGAALVDGDVNGALGAANRAVAANGDNAYAHYQLGLVANRQNNFQRAAQAFSRSVELKPDLAYGHYYAGLASQKIRQIAKMSEHLEMFLRLAPDAPERATVAALLRTLRG